MSSPEIVRLLRAIADAIERNDSLEISTIIRSLNRPASATRPKKTNVEKREKAIKSVDLALITKRLLNTTDRTVARTLLENEHLTRRELTELGQRQNVHIVKEDTVVMIETKIVESLVGSRLSSRAIRGEG